MIYFNKRSISAACILQFVFLFFYLSNNNSYAKSDEGQNQNPALFKPKVNMQSLLSTSSMQTEFIENKGQVTDQYHNPRPDIQFMLRAEKGLSIFIGTGALHYQFSNWSSGAGDCDENVCSMYRMDVELVGANKNAKVVTEQLQANYENHYVPGVDINNATAHAYKKVTYKNIYPNIDWVLYIKSTQLEHEFVVHTGGRVSDIQLKYGGATTLRIDGNGALVATTPRGEITEAAPLSYQQDGRKVKSSFRLTDNMLSYSVDKYTGELVIDPILVWATYFGGSGVEQRSVNVGADASGNVYLTGLTTSTSGIATTGAYDVTFGGGIAYGDAFIAKFNSTGAIQWATYYGGSSEERVWAGVADAAGNTYITGETYSTTGISTAGAHQVSKPSLGGTAYLAKFNSSGMIQWGTYYGGGGVIGFGVAADLSGNVYLTGVTTSSTDIATPGAHQTTHVTGAGDAFVVKFNGSGVRQWGTYYGGNGADIATSVAVNAVGDIFVCGETESATAIATAGAHQVTPDLSFLVKFNSAGVRQWGTYYGGYVGGGARLFNSTATDNSGNVYLAGATNSASGIATVGAYEENLTGIDAAFLVKFDGMGTRKWGTYYAGGANYRGLCTDGAGNVFISGYTKATSGFATADAYQSTITGKEEGYVVQFSSVGVRQWATYFGGAEYDDVLSVAADNVGNFYLAGTTRSTAGIATAGAYQTVNAGGYDAFIAKFKTGLSGIKNNEPKNNVVKLHPNPSNGVFTVDVPYSGTIELYSAEGRQLHAYKINKGSNKLEVPAGLPAGMYMLQYLGEDGTSEKLKLMYQR